LIGEELVRVEDAVWVQKPLDAPHGGDGGRRTTVPDVLTLLEPQTVLRADAAPGGRKEERQFICL